MEEEWRSLEPLGFPNYEVSNIGRFRNKNTKRILRLHEKGKYLEVQIYGKDGKHYSKRAHRLICITFNGPPPNDQLTIDHINRNGKDNRSENLRYLTPLDQCKNRKKHKGKGLPIR